MAFFPVFLSVVFVVRNQANALEPLLSEATIAVESLGELFNNGNRPHTNYPLTHLNLLLPRCATSNFKTVQLHLVFEYYLICLLPVISHMNTLGCAHDLWRNTKPCQPVQLLW